MDSIEDKPRQHPKPVPFFQTSSVQPTVPEVSLLLQESLNSEIKKDNSFQANKFQTYNSWRWNHMNSHRSSDSNKVIDSTSEQDCYLIKDKYFTSDIEKRKNEILYGESEEPRRPLPPRANPVIPACVQSFFSSSSLDDLRSTNCSSEKQQKSSNSVEKNVGIDYPSQKYFQKELNNSQKLYDIISEQSKQLHVLQDQIQQLLKLQDVKDKQIEQLLKSQESKEKKIEQLLQSLETKEHEIKQLAYSKGKDEQYIQELLKKQEMIQKENFNLLKKINNTKQREVQSVGIVACVQLTDAETCTSLDDILKPCSSQRPENNTEDISVIRESSRFDEKSLSLHSSDLPVIQENIPSPQSSIHVDIQDFPDSSDDSESEEGILTNTCTGSKESQSNHLGYTFYNNVLTQLQGIIHNSGEREASKKGDSHEVPRGQPLLQENFAEEVNSYHESSIPSREKNERSSDKNENNGFKGSNSPSDVSLKINALALKYLKREQISEFALQTSIPTSCQHDVTIYNVTNLSFGSLRYLDRYQMLPEVRENQRCKLNLQKGESSPSEFLRRKKKLTIEESITSNIGNILDISTLNQQPKLL